jgi:hypothetical protein
MYTFVGVQKLSETQQSRLRNGHPVRIQKGSGNQLTNEQIKKLESSVRRGTTYTSTLDPHQTEKHGTEVMGDMFSKEKVFAQKHKDLINPIIGRVRDGPKSGIDKLAGKANEKVDEYIKPIEGEGIIGNMLKGLIGMTTLGMKKHGRPKKILTEMVNNEVGVRIWKGVLANIIKTVAPDVIDTTFGAAKGKVGTLGSGVACFVSTKKI